MGETTQEVTSPTVLFSQEERHNIVRSFIWSYITGSVKIAFPTEAELRDPVTKEKLLEVGIQDIENSTKTLFRELMMMSSGAAKATQDQVDTAINRLFGLIFNLRNGHRLEGILIKPEVESRVDSLEERVSGIEKLFEELRNRLKVQGP